MCMCPQLPDSTGEWFEDEVDRLFDPDNQEDDRDDDEEDD